MTITFTERMMQTQSRMRICDQTIAFRKTNVIHISNHFFLRLTPIDFPSQINFKRISILDKDSFWKSIQLCYTHWRLVVCHTPCSSHHWPSHDFVNISTKPSLEQIAIIFMRYQLEKLL